MSLPNLLEGEGHSLTAGALLYTFSRSLVSFGETHTQPRRAVVQEEKQRRPVGQTYRRISQEEVALHHHPDSAWLIIKQKVAPWEEVLCPCGGGGSSPASSWQAEYCFRATLCV